MTDEPLAKGSLEVLTRARELISTPDKWTQGAYARSADGRSVNCLSREAVCFCSEGAVMAAQGVAGIDIEILSPIEFLDAAADALHGAYILSLNDDPDTTHAEVLAVFDKAIELAAQSQGSEAAGPSSSSSSNGRG